MKTSGLAYLSLFVADLAKSRAFYGEVLAHPDGNRIYLRQVGV